MLLQHGADPTLRNTEGKTALDVADPLTRPVLTGTDYKKDELLEAARYCTVLYYTVLYCTILYCTVLPGAATRRSCSRSSRR